MPGDSCCSVYLGVYSRTGGASTAHACFGRLARSGAGRARHASGSSEYDRSFMWETKHHGDVVVAQTGEEGEEAMADFKCKLYR